MTLHQQILDELTQYNHLSVEELALYLQHDKTEIFDAIVNLQSTGHIRQALPGRYCLVNQVNTQAADYPTESLYL